MRKKQLENIISYLDSIKEKSGDYQKYIESINALANKILAYYTPDETDKYKPITEDEYKALDDLFKDAIQKSDFYLETGFAEEENEIARDLKKNVCQRLHNDFLNEFYNDFKNIDLKSGKSFYEEMQKGKKVEVVEEKKENSHDVGDITESNIRTEGMFLKDHLTVTYNDEKVSGTFIYNKDYDPDKEIENLLKDFSIRYPEYKDYFSSLKDINILNELAGITNDEMIDKKGNLLNFFNDKNLEVSEIPAFNENLNKNDFLSANAELIMKLRPVLKEINDFTVELNVVNGTNLDRRNVAVFGIAKMLGNGNEIPTAKAVAIEQNNNGKKTYVDGTFIEDVKGKTINEFDLKDPIRTTKLEDWDTVEAKKALANLQIIDFICGNQKRDINDIKFEFDPETKKLVAVHGINNEKSFYAPKGNDKEDFKGLDDIKVIDEEMATKIMAFDEVTFKASLAQYGLKEKEVLACWERALKLQGLIKQKNIIDDKEKDALKNDKLVIVSSEAWKDLKLTDLAKNNNIFAKAIEAKDELVGEAKIDKSLDDNYKILKIAYDNKLMGGCNLLQEAKLNAPLFGMSKHYSNVVKALDAYQNAETAFDKSKKLLELEEKVEAYKEEKFKDGTVDVNGNILKKMSGKDLNRFNIVGQIGEFINKTKKLGDDLAIALSLKEANEKEVDDFNATNRLGKYKNYAKLYKDDNGKILINSNILERERRNADILEETTKKMTLLEKAGDFNKNQVHKQQYEMLKNYLEENIKNNKEQLKNDYHHGVIPKEFFDYKNDKYDKKDFDFKDDEKLFKHENPSSEIFNNQFHDEIKEEIKKDLEVEMIEMEDKSNENELNNAIEDNQLEKQ